MQVIFVMVISRPLTDVRINITLISNFDRVTFYLFYAYCLEILAAVLRNKTN